ncbi:MAG: hypothetical protein HY094_02740 [Candidatus Melainabacteria bacterium]|nr:hypothetical protein [Candidatus Melainabacteria bacterium]
MATVINRKQIENYYEEEWSQIASEKTIDLLVELTCQSCYQLNQTHKLAFIRQKEIPKLQNLGQI